MALFLAGCGLTRRMGDDEIFLRRNNIVIENQGEKFALDKDRLDNIIKQEPNRKIIWVKFNLGMYNLINPIKREEKHQKKIEKHERKIEKQENKIESLETENAKEKKILRNKNKLKELKNDNPRTWRDWLSYTVGEEPVVFDSLLMEKSARQLEIFLHKNGYFQGKVETEVKEFKKGKRVIAQYHITPNTKYTIRKLAYQVNDPGIKRRIDFIESQSSVKSGDRFDIDALDDERDRITNYLNNRGFYSFTKDYIDFDADSTLGSHQVDMTMKIKSINVESLLFPDSLIEYPHKKYFIGDIFIHTSYNPADIDYHPTDSLDAERATILYDSLLKVKSSLILHSLFFNKGELYQKDRVSHTYRNFAKLDVFRSVNIQFSPNESDGQNRLDCHILLSPAKNQSIYLESTGTHRNGNLGVSANTVYRHKNIFRGAEALEIKLTTGFEAQRVLSSETEETTVESEVKENIRFNTFEIGPEFSLFLHRLYPIRIEKLSPNAEPITTLTGTFNYQSRPDYVRYLTKFKYGYNWIENKKKGSRLYWDLWELSIIDIDKEQAFIDRLEELNNTYLSRSYENHLISSGRLAWLRNSQISKNQSKYFYNKVSLESAGSLLRLAHNLSSASTNEDGGYEILGIQYAHFLKLENDFRIYRVVDEKNTFAMRLKGGIGRPMSNLGVLPFEESFFVGGANSIRAWKSRTLGPGSYRDPNTSALTFNSIGEILIETNMEYRFGFTDMVKGAFFIDVGNIWLTPSSAEDEQSAFSKDFLSELAVGAGLGIRLDFDFFLFRLDFGLQLKDPSMDKGERWMWQDKDAYYDYLLTLDNPLPERVAPGWNFNLGIGYPF